MRRKAMAVCLLGAVLLAGCGSGGSAKGVKTFTEPGTVNGEVTSAKRNESAVLIKAGGAALINNAELSRKYAGKAGKADTAVVLLEAGKAVIKNSNLTSDAAGSAGILIGDTAEVEIADTALSTAGEQSPGIETRGSGALYAWDNMIGTTGNDSAALSVGKDGSMTLSGGTFTATGEHAPAVSASGKGWINAATLTAGNAEALTLEDGAQLSLYDCHVSGNMPEPGGNQKNAAVILRRAENSEANATAPQLLLSGGTLRAQSLLCGRCGCVDCGEECHARGRCIAGQFAARLERRKEQSERLRRNDGRASGERGGCERCRLPPRCHKVYRRHSADAGPR